MVARDGIEPPTPAFSGLISSTIKLLKPNWLRLFFTSKNGLQLQPIATIGLVSVCSLQHPRRWLAVLRQVLSMANHAFSKFIRPDNAPGGPITARDLDIIDAVLRYRFISAAQLGRLVGGNEDVSQRRLRRLWEKGLVSRWAFPGIRTHSEFYYYLDSR